VEHRYNAVHKISLTEISMDGTALRAQRALSISELEAQITELTGHLNAASHRWLVLIAEFDRCNGWSDSATQSCAHWLNWRCGIDLGAAREKLRVAHALEKLPRISAAMARGELSYSKVRALTRVAAAETEELLLSIALHGTAHHVETVVRHYRRAQQAEELSREARQQANRRVSYYFDGDGSLVLKASLPAEAGALLVKAFEAALEASSSPDVSAETSREQPEEEPKEEKPSSAARRTDASVVKEEKPSVAARRADALVAMAESFLKHGAAALGGGDRHQVVAHVDATTLHDGTAGRCELEDGPAIPAETARRLPCDASIVTLVENNRGEPLNIGRKTRSIPPAIRRALNARDRGCRFPGCPNTRYLDGHHVHHWAHGGETKLSNLVMLCRFHHRQVPLPASTKAKSRPRATPLPNESPGDGSRVTVRSQHVGGFGIPAYMSAWQFGAALAGFFVNTATRPVPFAKAGMLTSATRGSRAA
jgi:hypothetical protein